MMVGDYLAVSKHHYGQRIPQTVFALPFMHHTLVLTKTVPSYVGWIELPYMRLPGTTTVKNNDPIVFNYPDGDTVIIEMQDRLCVNKLRQMQKTGLKMRLFGQNWDC